MLQPMVTEVRLVKEAADPTLSRQHDPGPVPVCPASVCPSVCRLQLLNWVEVALWFDEALLHMYVTMRCICACAPHLTPLWFHRENGVWFAES